MAKFGDITKSKILPFGHPTGSTPRLHRFAQDDAGWRSEDGATLEGRYSVLALRSFAAFEDDRAEGAFLFTASSAGRELGA